MRAAVALGLAWAALVTSPAALARDVLDVEAVGAVALWPELGLPAAPRDAAVREGLLEAVRLTAMELLGDVQTAQVDLPLDEILGGDPYAYANRFQVIEDRGESPALFSADPGAEFEYVVIVSVSVDRDRVRERLEASGLLVPGAGGAALFRIQLTLEGLHDYWAYDAIRNALVVDLGVRSAVPVEFEPGRFTLDVEASRTPEELLRPLQRAVEEQLELTPVAVERDAMSLRVETLSREPRGAASPGSDEIDTPNRNRY